MPKVSNESKAHPWELVSKYKPTGSQPDAIGSLVDNINAGVKDQVLLGVTGSGKTFTMANVIRQLDRPALIIAHNKTLAAQLCNEFRAFFPNNRVEYFVSYYDYYQPEAYMPATDTYIEKDMSINDEIDKLRHSATCSLADRRDVIVVASVSCIYGLGAPKEYYDLAISLRPGDKFGRNDLIKKLSAIQYKRAGDDIERATFRSKGDTVDIIPSHTTTTMIRVMYNGDVVEGIFEMDALTVTTISTLNHVAIFPATHYAVGSDKLHGAIQNIRADLGKQLAIFNDKQQMIEEHRLKQRTNYDLEMMQEMGYCNGIENYSRYFDGRKAGEPPYTLMSYMGADFITFIDESHITVPQIRGMYNGDRARKTSLVDFGFRLPSAYDNRPLNFAEFNQRLGQTVYVSATPAEYEMEGARGNKPYITEQIIRPTGLLDPEVFVRPKDHQVTDLLSEIRALNAKSRGAGGTPAGKTLVTTLTKKMAEDLTAYFTSNGVRVRYLHSEIDTLERVSIITALRKDEFDVIVGINLLREGLDIPEVELVAILDADKEGLFRSKRSLIQTIGRAARNANARVILYANTMTESMRGAIDETNRRRQIQQDYNKKHGITPKTVYSDIRNTLYVSDKDVKSARKLNRAQVKDEIEKLTALMNIAAKSLDFEAAIKFREEITRLKKDI
ncbi:MAG: excinuclease ABC subunit UvrB [Christensenellaceae bacterium]|jgi:excinuclease ABC subunit B|nr:excinuclease ABC subunit UvrB [Christensenellaceae bacterium]